MIWCNFIWKDISVTMHVFSVDLKFYVFDSHACASEVHYIIIQIVMFFYWQCVDFFLPAFFCRSSHRFSTFSTLILQCHTLNWETIVCCSKFNEYCSSLGGFLFVFFTVNYFSSPKFVSMVSYFWRFDEMLISLPFLFKY